jgi:hypothetical protein
VSERKKERGHSITHSLSHSHSLALCDQTTIKNKEMVTQRGSLGDYEIPSRNKTQDEKK